MSTTKFLAMFPGQGSQAVTMGQAFLASEPLAQRRFAEADEALAFSLTELCLEGPQEELSQTQYAQPAILTVSAIAFEIFTVKKGYIPTVAAGHSLGEYSALVAAGVLSFQEAVLLVHKRGLYMQAAVAPGQGSMVAILGKESAEIEQAMSTVTVGHVGVANVNAPGQIVIAGDKAAVEETIANLGKVKAIPLPVSVPSHTVLMQPAAEKLKADFNNVKFSPPKFPVYSNVTGKPSKDVDEVRQTLIQQLTRPVQWVDCVRNAVADFAVTELVEFGHGQVLCGLAKRILPDIKKTPIDSPAAVEAINLT